MVAPIRVESGITIGGGITIGDVTVPVTGGSMNFAGTTAYNYWYNSGSGLQTSSTNVTVEFWMRPTSNPGGVFLWGTDAGDFRIDYASGTLTVTPPTGATMSYTVAANTWTYICTGNFNGAGRLTVNGVNRGSSGTSNYTWNGSAYVGAVGGSFFDGQLTNVRLSNADVRGIGGGGGFSVPTQPLTATPGTTLLLLNATTAGTVTDDTSGNNIPLSSIRPPTWSALTPY